MRIPFVLAVDRFTGYRDSAVQPLDAAPASHYRCLCATRSLGPASCRERWRPL